MSNMSQLFDASRFPDDVKVRANGKATVMTLYGSENGSLRLFSLWEGAILSFNRIYTQVWPLAQNEAANILLLNFCRKGRCEVALEDGQFAFLSQGHMAVGTQQAQEEYRYPSGLYEGVELFLDLDMLAHRPYPLFQEGEVSPEGIVEHLHTSRRLYLGPTPACVQTLLDDLWQLRDSEEVGLLKLLSAQLLWKVERQPLETSPTVRYFTSSQVSIARETRNILCADLSQNHTARELADRFQVAETSLKNYFRGVFGENLSTFLREVRMRRAAELLQSSELRVAEIAAQVGYENQSKFADNAKIHTSMHFIFICIMGGIRMETTKGHYIFGTVKVGERGQIIIPKEARQVFDIKAGDTLIVLGDEKWGIAVTKADVLEKHAYDVFKKISEGHTDADQ